jgi:ABC-type transport system involved in cytochrome bd biosynthesis fused ATPase/permease subunit
MPMIRKWVAKGIHTNIGDSGNKLSVVKNKGFLSLVLFEKSSIMILDEATSALDTEVNLYKWLLNMMQNRTSIVASSSTIQKQTIIVMQKEKL